jgi:hypothetical protein
MVWFIIDIVARKIATSIGKMVTRLLGEASSAAITNNLYHPSVAIGKQSEKECAHHRRKR